MTSELKNPAAVSKAIQRPTVPSTKEIRGQRSNRKHRRSIKVDRVSAADLARYNGQFFCDDCSHFNSRDLRCTIGLRALHTRAEQMALYNLSGSMAFCRSIEID